MIPPFEPNPAVKHIQPKVQRRLGRVLIQIQQYEKLLKTLLVASELEGTIKFLPTFKEKRIEKYKNMTLGTLITEAKNSFLRTEPLPGVDDKSPVVNEIFLRSRWAIQFTHDNAAVLYEDMNKLLTLRNNLVHHFIEQFDIFSIEGCRTALLHLDESRKTVDAAHAILRQWAHGMVTTYRQLADAIQSQQLSDIPNDDEQMEMEQTHAKS